MCVCMVGDGVIMDVASTTLSLTETTPRNPPHRMYKDDGLKGGHVIMLGPGCEEAALAALQAYPQGLQIGGACPLLWLSWCDDFV